ncbi:MAG: SDR family oxidoreductase [Ferrovibrio sp.]|uniref:SDR family oxidoreductase n=1 Tax=Ferrovibrio sp. TaxID=1917215 RepID=UPI00262322C1|nr:SDR family oxidoreductase [Ferrovibrio sp.]MCW0234507.1 SDR family oxidoreductase [Ferrovibrio sp.]
MSTGISLKGKVAVVTGASSGLGERFAELLSGAGASVALAARRTDRLKTLADRITTAGGTAITVKLDVNDYDNIQGAFAEIAGKLGGVDVLINNSGVNKQGRIVDVTPDDFDFAMNTNAKGAFFVAQAAARDMIARKAEGRIINIASVAGLKVLSQLSVYCMSKAAVVQMTKAMALEWARYGINTNAICPGYIETEINRDYWGTPGGKKLVEMLPRRRVGEPKDLDGLILLLASNEARFINGAIIAADDGLTVT